MIIDGIIHPDVWDGEHTLDISAARLRARQIMELRCRIFDECREIKNLCTQPIPQPDLDHVVLSCIRMKRDLVRLSQAMSSTHFAALLGQTEGILSGLIHILFWHWMKGNRVVEELRTDALEVVQFIEGGLRFPGAIVPLDEDFVRVDTKLRQAVEELSEPRADKANPELLATMAEGVSDLIVSQDILTHLVKRVRQRMPDENMGRQMLAARHALAGYVQRVEKLLDKYGCGNCLQRSKVIPIRSGGQFFFLRLEDISKIVKVPRQRLFSRYGRLLFADGKESIGIVDLADVLFKQTPQGRGATGDGVQDPVSVVILGEGDQKLGLMVDDYQREREAVVRSLPDGFKALPFIVGAVVLENGSLASLLDGKLLLRSIT